MCMCFSCGISVYSFVLNLENAHSLVGFAFDTIREYWQGEEQAKFCNQLAVETCVGPVL